MVGGATDPRSTLAALTSLRRGGRLVLMGSMTVDLPIPYTAVMLNDWEILGQFMYPASAYRRLLDLLRSGLLEPRRRQAACFLLVRASGRDGGRRGGVGLGGRGRQNVAAMISPTCLLTALRASMESGPSV